mgnify:CR=1 FL=1
MKLLKDNFKNKGEKIVIIEVEKKEVYGRELFYPVNSIARELCIFKNSKTLRGQELKRFQRIGFKVSLVQQKIDF